MNWKKGFFRLWIAISALWCTVVLLFFLIVETEATGSIKSSFQRRQTVISKQYGTQIIVSTDISRVFKQTGSSIIDPLDEKSIKGPKPLSGRVVPQDDLPDALRGTSTRQNSHPETVARNLAEGRLTEEECELLFLESASETASGKGHASATLDPPKQLSTITIQPGRKSPGAFDPDAYLAKMSSQDRCLRLAASKLKKVALKDIRASPCLYIDYEPTKRGGKFLPEYCGLPAELVEKLGSVGMVGEIDEVRKQVTFRSITQPQLSDGLRHEVHRFLIDQENDSLSAAIWSLSKYLLLLCIAPPLVLLGSGLGIQWIMMGFRSKHDH
ncbi:MAG: hypothetical protein EB072_16845, partial [Betaproteobacteria bacterium]|nr:hypothetical protein [Betaproteobacteria bacterium]